jgi:hypothetical protein
MNEVQKLQTHTENVQQRLEKQSFRAILRSAGNLAVSGAMGYVAYKSGTPVETAIFAASATGMAGAAAIEAHTAITTGQGSAALEGALLADQLAAARQQTEASPEQP